MTTYPKLEEIRDKAIQLHQLGVIKKCTEEFFLKSHASLNKEINQYKTQHMHITEANLKYTLNHILLLDVILSKIEQQNCIDHSCDGYFIDILNKIGNFNDLDIWVIKHGTLKTPSCFPYISHDALSFILIIPEYPDYLNLELIGLLAHEASHIHATIAQTLRSRKSEKRKIGESLTDLLAYILTDSLYLHSVSHFINNVIGMENVTKTRPAHLSWMARMLVLNYLTDRIWQNKGIAEKNKDYFRVLLNNSLQINLLENNLITLSIREGENKMEEFIEFKIDETVLSNIRNLPAAGLGKFGEVIRVIYDIEVPN